MISIIAAVSKNNVIGCGGKIPWDIPEDMEYFRKKTTGNIVIMGRNTFEEIGKPLPDRFNIIVSQSKNYMDKNLITVRSLEEAISFAEKYASEHENISEIFLCGGERIYKDGLKYAEKIYVTEIDKVYNGDAFFPDLSCEKFQLSEVNYGKTAGIKFCVYELK